MKHDDVHGKQFTDFPTVAEAWEVAQFVAHAFDEMLCTV